MSQRPLFLLRFKKSIADKQRADLNRRAITEVQPHDRVYVDLRRYGEAWYVQRELPDTYRTIHVVEVLYTKWQGNQHKKIYAKCLLWNEELLWTHYDVYCYGTRRELILSMTLVDETYAKDNPTCIPDELQEAVLKRISS